MSRIRLAKVGDANGISAVHIATWRSIYAGLVPDRVLTRMSEERTAMVWEREIAASSDGRRVHVALASDDRVVGFVSHGAARDPAMGIDGEVFTLYVLDDFQGNGLGRALLTEAFRHLLGRGMASAMIWVLARNPSRFFYEAMGGRRLAEREEVLWGERMPEIGYVWRDLGEEVRKAR